VVDLLEGGSNKFKELSAALRAKLHKIRDIPILATVQDYLNYVLRPPASTDDCADVLERDAGPNMISASDQWLRELKIASLDTRRGRSLQSIRE
jgi:hypothetical protein